MKCLPCSSRPFQISLFDRTREEFHCSQRSVSQTYNLRQQPQFSTKLSAPEAIVRSENFSTRPPPHPPFWSIQVTTSQYTVTTGQYTGVRTPRIVISHKSGGYRPNEDFTVVR